MGLPYYKAFAQFDRGEYIGANNLQDDFHVMARRLPLLPQTGGSTLLTAAMLPPAESPGHGLAAVSGTGLVSRGPGEPELWAFEAGGPGNATITLSVLPPSSSGSIRSMLDAVVALRSPSNQLLTVLNPPGINSSNGLGIGAVTVMLPAAGRYTVVVSGGGGGGQLSLGGYSSYVRAYCRWLRLRLHTFSYSRNHQTCVGNLRTMCCTFSARACNCHPACLPAHHPYCLPTPVAPYYPCPSYFRVHVAGINSQ
jgi:hypothetical protein